MSRAFRHLLRSVQRMHETHAQLAAFCAFPDDISEQPCAPYDIPAAALIYGDTGQTVPKMKALRDAFVAAGPEALWRETYKDTNIGSNFMDRFGCYCLIGTGGPFTSAQLSGYVVFMPAGLHYT